MRKLLVIHALLLALAGCAPGETTEGTSDPSSSSESVSLGEPSSSPAEEPSSSSSVEDVPIESEDVLFLPEVCPAPNAGAYPEPGTIEVDGATLAYRNVMQGGGDDAGTIQIKKEDSYIRMEKDHAFNKVVLVQEDDSSEWVEMGHLLLNVSGKGGEGAVEASESMELVPSYTNEEYGVSGKKVRICTWTLEETGYRFELTPDPEAGRAIYLHALHISLE